jgi:hypothetical protein
MTISDDLREFYAALDKVPNYVVSLEVLYAGDVPRADEAEEDRQARKKGELRGAQHAAAFVNDHRSLIDRLIGTYSDDVAARALAELREAFWAEEWQPSELPTEEPR